MVMDAHGPSRAGAPRPVVATGQQIGAGWSPALSVAKALAALAEARRTGAEAVYWLADEDHDRTEVAAVVGWREGRMVRHRFRFEAPEGTATGWLPWTEGHQIEAETLWGPCPAPSEPTLRGHALALGAPLWQRGLRPFSPTDPAIRSPLQPVLEGWRALDLEGLLVRQAERLAAEGAPLTLDPRTQAAWFALDPISGLRRRLDPGQPLPGGHWLSPGAALRPLMQSLLLPVETVVLGPSERAYWRLCEPLWDCVGLAAPRILARPSVFVAPRGTHLDSTDLPLLQSGNWAEIAAWRGTTATTALGLPTADATWPEAVRSRFAAEMARTRTRLGRLDRRLHREAAAATFGGDPEHLRQALFPFDRPQERVIPGLAWLRDEALLDRILDRMDGHTDRILLEAP